MDILPEGGLNDAPFLGTVFDVLDGIHDDIEAAAAVEATAEQAARAVEARLHRERVGAGAAKRGGRSANRSEYWRIPTPVSYPVGNAD